ncbi:MAG: hypothetical protein ACM3SW_12230 [Actinomycetota bacterium]
MPVHQPTEQELAAIIREVVANVRKREQSYLPRAAPLSEAHKEAMQPFFPRWLLEEVRVLELTNERVPNPPYHERARKRGYALMLDFTHMPDITHPQLIIFQEKLSPRLLFHALVHVMQYAVLGLETYLELYVRAFMQIGSYPSVPLEAQAFRLDQRYTEDAVRGFSVEDEVRQWSKLGKYLLPETGQRKLGT